MDATNPFIVLPRVKALYNETRSYRFYRLLKTIGLLLRFV